jgi:superfamily I DNA/RNA helicase
MAVIGGAGTGKTVLAFEKALRLARNGLKVLLLCYTKELAEYLQHAAKGVENLTIGSYHSFAASVCRGAGIDLPIVVSEQEKLEFYEKKLPEALFEVVAAPTGPRFDALIVDEARDFPELWWTTLECLLRDREQGCLYAFYDDNQNVFHRTSKFLDTLAVPFRLSKNLRNAKAIFESFASYYRGDLYEAGNDCAGEVSFHPDVTDASSLLNLSKGLLTREGIAPADIVLLSCTGLTTSRFSPENVLRELAMEQRAWGAVRAASVRKFKGLESPVVVLLDVQEGLSDLAVLYTALSRAQLRLCVAGVAGPLTSYKDASKP